MASSQTPTKQTIRSKKLFLLLLRAIFVLSLALLASSARAQTAITSDEYWRKVNNTQTLVGALEGLPEADIHSALQDEAIKWETISAVILPDDEIVLINSSYLAALLRADPPDPARIKAFLNSLLAAKEGMAASGGNIQALDELGRILARSEFQWAEAQANPVPSPLQKFFARINQFLAEMFSKIANFGISVGFNLPTIISAALLALVIYSIIRGAFINIISEADLLEEDQEGEMISANTALQKAQQLSTGGDYRTAVRYLYLSALLLLEDRGLLNYDHSKTNSEYIRSLANHPELAANLRGVVDVFDRVWYGFRPIDTEGYDKYTQRVMSLKEQK